MVITLERNEISTSDLKFVLRKRISKILRKFGHSTLSIFTLIEAQPDRRTDGHRQIDFSCHADQEYIYFAGSATPPSPCYKLYKYKNINNTLW